MTHSPQVATTAPPSPSVLPADGQTAATMLALHKLLTERLAGARTSLIEHARTERLLRPGARFVVDNPADPDRELATVTVPKPSAPKHTVTDEPALHDWIREHHDDLCRDHDQLAPGRTADVIAALRDYAPDDVVADLVHTSRTVPGWAVEDILRASDEAGQVVGPGGEIDDDAPPGIAYRSRQGVPSVKLAADATEQFTALADDPGHLGALLAIPAPADPADN
ncbi:hypothetical protein [Pseudonocardia sp. NPDC049635]|uniref:hypothetical protein n=1 Tax=Pseudonocardia sp. NPDC049635 TaxID=3155506 RepID=UPI0033F467C2